MKNRNFLLWVMIGAILFGSLAGCGKLQTLDSETSEPAVQTTADSKTEEPALNPGPEAVWPVEDWQASAPERQGMDSEKLAAMLEYVSAKHIRLHSLLIVRNGSMVFEAYFNPYTAEDPHQIASITKSVIGALIGIAIQQGKIQSVEQPLADFFGGRQIAGLDARKQSITLEHLLMLAPGFDCSDIEGTEARMTQSQDWVQFVLDLPMADDPGEKWAYCSSAVHLVSAVLQEATGMDARAFANEYLFKPIGIAEVPQERWPSDPAGISTGGNGLMLTPGELARFAYLYLNGGRWEDRQVVPAEWVAASTTPHIEVGKMKEYGDMNRSYGYLWSLYPEQKFYSALGRNGQHIHVFPEENMLVVFTSATPVASDERQFTLLKDYILPAIRSKTALPENPEAAAKLEALLADAAMPRQPVADLPPAAQMLNGKPIRIPDSSVGWETVTFTFKEGENTADLLFDTGEHLSVGLDNLYRLQDLPGETKQGFRGTWDREDRFTLEQLILGTWLELDVSMTIEGDQVTFFQRNPVDGGNLIRFEGVIEE